MTSLLNVNNISYSTPTGRWLQKNISFQVADGQLLSISGSNGAGKSTLLRILLGKQLPQSGNARWRTGMESIEFLPQLENMATHLPLTLRDVLKLSSSTKKMQRDVLDSWGLLREDQLDHGWNTASGGERKKTLFMRALLRKPSVLIMDEPMNHLDVGSRRAMIRCMEQFLNESVQQPRAIIMVNHQGFSEQEASLFDLVPLKLEASTAQETIC